MLDLMVALKSSALGSFVSDSFDIDTSSWSSKLLELINQEQVSVVAYELDLNYDYWTYRTWGEDNDPRWPKTEYF